MYFLEYFQFKRRKRSTLFTVNAMIVVHQSVVKKERRHLCKYELRAGASMPNILWIHQSEHEPVCQITCPEVHTTPDAANTQVILHHKHYNTFSLFIHHDARRLKHCITNTITPFLYSFITTPDASNTQVILHHKHCITNTITPFLYSFIIHTINWSTAHVYSCMHHHYCITF